MPNRIIKESIAASERIAALSDFEFRVWVGLITFVDDKGRGDARPVLLRNYLFPLREEVTKQEVAEALDSLARQGCINLYEVKGKPYFYFPNWNAANNNAAQPASKNNNTNAKIHVGVMAASTTGISNISAEEASKQAEVYNLSGQRVDASYKGIVVRNGRKYLRK